MLYEEAQWIGNTIGKLSLSGKKILNLGSSTLASRTVLQPQMEEFIFKPLRDENVEVVHCDITKDEGVDLQGDFTDPTFIGQLEEMKFDGVLCCNLFEHLEDRTPLINALKKIVPENGYLLLTVPFQYPYHLDPIDTLYRPTPEELYSNFPEFQKIEGEILTARRQSGNKHTPIFHKNYFQMLLSTPFLFIKLLIRVCLPFYKYPMWKITARDLKNMFNPFKVTCLLLKRSS